MKRLRNKPGPIFLENFDVTISDPDPDDAEKNPDKTIRIQSNPETKPGLEDSSSPGNSAATSTNIPSTNTTGIRLDGRVDPPTTAAPVGPSPMGFSDSPSTVSKTVTIIASATDSGHPGPIVEANLSESFVVTRNSSGPVSISTKIPSESNRLEVVEVQRSRVAIAHDGKEVVDPTNKASEAGARSYTFRPHPAINKVHFENSPNQEQDKLLVQVPAFDPLAFINSYYVGGWNDTDVKSMTSSSSSSSSLLPVAAKVRSDNFRYLLRMSNPEPVYSRTRRTSEPGIEFHFPDDKIEISVPENSNFYQISSSGDVGQNKTKNGQDRD